MSLSLGAGLQARRLGDAGEVLPPAEALTRFDAAPGAIGYLYAPRAAHWVRVDTDGTVVTSSPDRAATRPADLGEVFEVHLTDGARHLRWRHRDGGRGAAVELREDEGMTPERGIPRRLGEYERLLAGHVVADDAPPGWATVSSARLGSFRVPLSAPPGEDRPTARFAEYAVVDEHGNVDVVDTLLLGLEAAAGTATDGNKGSGR